MAKTTAQPGAGATQPAVGHEPIDMDHLQRQSLGDSGLQEEILRLYRDMAAIYFSRIEQSANATELAEHLHTLKSAAAGIGAWTVRDLTRAAEDDLRGGKVDPERIDDIEMAVNECAAFITDLLEDKAA
jgi:HPt (histidine-containing phosphotransfer) domain-containing protein